MMGKTHLAIGIASAMLILQPSAESALIATAIGGAAGGIMADIDVKIDRSNKYAQKASMDALYGEISAIAITVALLLADWIKGFGLCSSIIEKPITLAIGIALLIALIILGEISKHRDRTHSLLALVLFTAAGVLINMQIGIALGIGYASHLIIDLLNKSPERLLYPLKKGICFKVCYADRLGNDLLFSAGLALTAFYLAVGPITGDLIQSIKALLGS